MTDEKEEPTMDEIMGSIRRVMKEDANTDREENNPPDKNEVPIAHLKGSRKTPDAATDKEDFDNTPGSLEKAGQIPVQDAIRIDVDLSDQTRKMCRNLQFCLLASVTIVILGFSPTKVGLIGLEVQNGRTSLALSIFLLSVFFAILGWEPWRHDRASFKNRTSALELDLKRSVDPAQYTPEELSEMLDDPDNALPRDVMERYMGEAQQRKLEKEGSNKIRLYFGADQSMTAATKTWKRNNLFQDLQYFCLPAAIPFICLTLAIIDIWLNPEAPPPNWDVGNFDELLDLFDKP